MNREQISFILIIFIAILAGWAIGVGLAHLQHVKMRFTDRELRKKIEREIAVVTKEVSKNTILREEDKMWLYDMLKDIQHLTNINQFDEAKMMTQHVSDWIVNLENQRKEEK